MAIVIRGVKDGAKVRIRDNSGKVVLTLTGKQAIELEPKAFAAVSNTVKALVEHGVLSINRTNGDATVAKPVVQSRVIKAPAVVVPEEVAKPVVNSRVIKAPDVVIPEGRTRVRKEV